MISCARSFGKQRKAGEEVVPLQLVGAADIPFNRSATLSHPAVKHLINIFIQLQFVAPRNNKRVCGRHYQFDRYSR